MDDISLDELREILAGGYPPEMVELDIGPDQMFGISPDPKDEKE